MKALQIGKNRSMARWENPPVVDVTRDGKTFPKTFSAVLLPLSAFSASVAFIKASLATRKAYAASRSSKAARASQTFTLISAQHALMTSVNRQSCQRQA